MKKLFAYSLAGAVALTCALAATAQTGSSSKDSQASTTSHARAYFSADMDKFDYKTGQEIYNGVCAGCHMAQGQGAKGSGFYPALAKNPKLAAAAYPVLVVSNGYHGMPSFAGRLTNQQIADVVNYVRSNFGNDYKDTVKPEDVQPMRPSAESMRSTVD